MNQYLYFVIIPLFISLLTISYYTISKWTSNSEILSEVLTKEEQIDVKIERLLKGHGKNFSLNMDYALRDDILWLDIDWEKSQVEKNFVFIDYHALRLLLYHDFIAITDKEKTAPRVKDFYLLIEKYPYLKIGWYAVSPNRWDYRVRLDGIWIEEWGTIPQDGSEKWLQKRLANFCKTADTYKPDRLMCWRNVDKN